MVVPDYQLSLAIGKEGQNARLAARLTGWRIDIRSDSPSDDQPDDKATPASPDAPATLDAPATPTASAAPDAPGATGAPASEARTVPRQGREVERDAGVGTASDSASS